MPPTENARSLVTTGTSTLLQTANVLQPALLDLAYGCPVGPLVVGHISLLPRLTHRPAPGS